jgi:signal transduction histidine kinase
LELENAYSKLKNLDEMKDNFLSSVSHELRTPLTSIKSYNQLLYDGFLGNINEGQKNALNVILSSTDHLISLINDLLDVAKYDSGKVVLHKSDFVLSDVLEIIRWSLAQNDRNQGKPRYQKRSKSKSKCGFR